MSRATSSGAVGYGFGEDPRRVAQDGVEDRQRTRRGDGGQALRLSRALGTTPQVWIDLQKDYEL